MSAGIRLTAFTDDHVEPMARTITDPEILRFTRIPVPTPDDWIDQWRRRYAESDNELWAVVGTGLAGKDRFAGYAVAIRSAHDDREVELGYAVSPWARGRGVATAALGLLTDWALGEDMLRLVLLISADNPASQRVAAKAGYVYEGTLRSVANRPGERVDLQSWSLLPTDPRPVQTTGS